MAEDMLVESFADGLRHAAGITSLHEYALAGTCLGLVTRQDNDVEKDMREVENASTAADKSERLLNECERCLQHSITGFRRYACTVPTQHQLVKQQWLLPDTKRTNELSQHF